MLAQRLAMFLSSQLKLLTSFVAEWDGTNFNIRFLFIKYCDSLCQFGLVTRVEHEGYIIPHKLTMKTKVHID